MSASAAQRLKTCGRLLFDKKRRITVPNHDQEVFETRPTTTRRWLISLTHAGADVVNFRNEPNFPNAARGMNDRLSMLCPDQSAVLKLVKNNRAYDQSSAQCAEPRQLIAEEVGTDDRSEEH